MHNKISALLESMAFIALLTITSSAGATAQLPTLTFGIVPQQSASKLAEKWAPLLSEIGRRAGVRLVFRTAPSIPVFEERLAKGEYDLAYMNPYHYVVFHKGNGFTAFAREKDRRIKGIIVVRKDSSIHQLADLKGMEVAFPAPAAFAASILPQAEFGRQHIPVEAKFVASHDSVYRAVASGLQPAGGGIQRTFEATPPEVRNHLRVLIETPSYTPHAFAAHPRVDTALIQKIVAAMQSMSDDATGINLLSPLAFKGFSTAEDKDWNDIRALDIRLLERYSNPETE
ncbi:MAG: phosphate/phosphite/phosphonate ABC transporter substrate-binding protein [Sideroxydans sp.]|nr:phosphate/phosphite/phosphonate ABC transporter substrate-binding protein [Sideroxydans sp.]